MGMKQCSMCRETSPHDAKYCIICGATFKAYTEATQQQLQSALFEPQYRNDGYPSPMPTGVAYIPLRRLTITPDQYWEFLSQEQLMFNARTGEMYLYGYPVDIDWSK